VIWRQNGTRHRAEKIDYRFDDGRKPGSDARFVEWRT
jgi:hypothetical protein